MIKFLIPFGLGAFSYGLIEVLWRGYTHWSMLTAGGLCFLLFSVIAERFAKSRFLYRCILGSLAVSSVELIFGVIFNLMLGLQVWDYSQKPFNLAGQICLQYSVLWGFLSVAAIPLAGVVSKKLKEIS